MAPASGGSLSFGVLGPLRVDGPDGPRPIGGRMVRGVLGILITHVGRPVRIDEIADQLWEERPPSAAEATLHVHVSRLRKALGDPSLVETVASGYALRADPAAVDACRFAQVVEAVTGSPPAAEIAVARLDEALGWWRGAAYADLIPARWAETEAAQLESLRVDALCARVEGRLDLGQHGAVTAELEALVAGHPLRERLWALLMVALYRSGRQADALRAFGRLRKVLAEELGVAPSEELSRLEMDVLNHADWLERGQVRAPGRISGPGRIPLPRRLEAIPLAGFVGRRSELDALARALASVGDRRGTGFVVLGGEPGIGKSSLAAEFARVAHATGAVVLSGRCEEEFGLPYLPWVDILGQVTGPGSSHSVRAFTEAHIADLAPLDVGGTSLGIVGSSRSVDPEAARYLLFGAVAGLFGVAAAPAPVVVVLDDLQWADPPTIQLLRYVIGARPPSVLIVATIRDSEVGLVGPLADLLAWASKDGMIERISLRGLGGADLRTLVEATVQSGEVSGLSEALGRETDGNPFFVGELLRHLSETGAVRRQIDGTLTVTGDPADVVLPASVREVIRHRVARLGDEAARALATASVIGREFDVPILALVLDADEAGVVDALDRAAGAALVAEVTSDRYAFAHALIERALYEGLSPARRARAHRQVAEAIEETAGGDPSQRAADLAHHYARSVTQDIAKAVSYAKVAGDGALAQLAPDDALRWYQQALDLLSRGPGDDHERTALLCRLGEAQRQAGQLDYRQTLLAASRLAARLDDTDLLVTAVLANNRGIFSSAGHLDTERVAMIEAALKAVGPGDSLERALLLSVLAVERTWDGDYVGRRQVADEALAIARRVGDPYTLLIVLQRRHDAIWVPGSEAERLANVMEGESLARLLGDPVRAFWCAFDRIIISGEAGDLDNLTRYVEVADATAAAISQPGLLRFATYGRSWVTLLAGRLQEAERLAERALAIATEVGDPDGLLVYGVQLGCIRWHQGRVPEILDAFEQVASEQDGTLSLLPAIALLSAESDRLDRARELLAMGRAGGFAHPFDSLLLNDLCCWAEAATFTEDVESAAMIYEQLAPWHHLVVSTGANTLGAVSQFLGQLARVMGRQESARAHLFEALELHQGLGAPFHVARTRLEWGRSLSADGTPASREAAREQLTEALRVARRHGCAAVERRAMEALARL